QPECSICCYNYDNIFKAPKQLECTHTFCLECLSRLMAVSQAEAQGDGDSERPPISCPLCRHLTTLPEEGPPALTTSSEVLGKLPENQQQVETVYLEGNKLCYQSSRHSADLGAPESPTPFCICIDIGARKKAEAPTAAQTQNHGMLGRLAEWKRMVLFFVLMVLLVVIVLWPLQCVFSTGNMRCIPDRTRTDPTAATSTFNPFTRPPRLAD
uniref:Ring finger protein 223 n=2 Tax=Echeneis naucrates TaxID=173247 RepID=A0A665VXN0_ECHNA